MFAKALFSGQVCSHLHEGRPSGSHPKVCGVSNTTSNTSAWYVLCEELQLKWDLKWESEIFWCSLSQSFRKMARLAPQASRSLRVMGSSTRQCASVGPCMKPRRVLSCGMNPAFQRQISMRQFAASAEPDVAEEETFTYQAEVGITLCIDSKLPCALAVDHLLYWVILTIIPAQFSWSWSPFTVKPLCATYNWNSAQGMLVANLLEQMYWSAGVSL